MLEDAEKSEPFHIIFKLNAESGLVMPGYESFSLHGQFAVRSGNDDFNLTRRINRNGFIGFHKDAVHADIFHFGFQNKIHGLKF